MENKEIKLMMAEDNLTDQMNFKHFIKHQKLSYNYNIAGSVAKAREILNIDQDFDVILLDHNLGDGTAFDLFEFIPATLPFVLITGAGDVEIAVKAMKLGASDYLVKDFEGDYLRLLPLTIANVIKAKKLENKLEDYKHHLERRVKEQTEELRHEIIQRKKAEEQIRISEERWQFALEGTKSGVWDWDLQSNKIFFSSRGKKILGYGDDKEDDTPNEWKKRVHPDDKAQYYADLERHFFDETPYYENEHRILCKNGSYKWILDRGKVTSWSKDHKPLRIIGTYHDITTRLQQEEQLRRSQKMDALGKLIGGIAHDYNNMMGIIYGYTDLLDSELTGQPKRKEYLHEIRHAAERSSKLTMRLLAFSRYKKTVIYTIDVNSLLQDQQNMLAKMLTASINLVYDLTEDLWKARLDIGDLEDAIINICINAMHAMESGGKLIIQTRNENISAIDGLRLNLDAGNYVLLSITDTGCGMNKQIKEKIFDPFYTTKGEKGTGLGLSQVYGFVDRCNGSIKVVSEPGHGTQFTFYFPRYYADGQDHKFKENKKTADIEGNKTILVVDDEPALLNLTCEMLRRHSYNTLCAKNGRQALQILEKESVDLLFSDVIMPEMNGYQLAAMVKKKYPTIKIQLFSGFADRHHADILDDNLHKNLLHKPFNLQTLLKRIQNCLDEKGE